MVTEITNGLRVKRMIGDPCLKHVLLVFVCTFLVILPLTFFSVRHSVYSLWQRDKDREQTKLVQANRRRLVENVQILRMFNTTHTLAWNTPAWNTTGRKVRNWQNLDVGITIISVSRNRHREKDYETKYLTQVVGRLLYLLNKAKTGLKYGLFVCNVDKEPTSHDEIKALPSFIPIFVRYSQVEQPPKDIFEKEKQDYVFCMEETLKLNPSYVFLVEDDAYPHRQLIPVLEHVIHYNIEARNAVGVRYRNVTYVKFYHPDRLLGYFSLEVERIPELIGASVFIGTVLFLFYMQAVPGLKHKKVYATWTLCIIFCCLVCISIGRQNLLELRRLSTHLYQVTPAPSCCTPAMLYPKTGGELIATHLKSMKCKRSFGKDMALEEIRKREKFVGVLVQPNVFEHIGMYSSVRQGMVDPFVV